MFLLMSFTLGACKWHQSKSSEMNTCEKRGGGGGIMLRSIAA